MKARLLGWGKQKGADHGYPKLAKQSKTPSGVKSSVESKGVIEHKFLKRNEYMGKCIGCGRNFSDKDYENASKGEPSPVGDWDDVCYDCQFSGVKSNQKQHAGKINYLKRIDSISEDTVLQQVEKNIVSKDGFGNPIGTRYDIVRFFSKEGKRPKVIHRDVSDVVARLHCNDPRTRKAGVYFDGFRKRS